MKLLSKLALTVVIALILPLPAVRADNIFLNEFHYDNVSTDSNEFIEIAIDASLDINNLSVQLYRSNGTIYGTRTGSSFTLGSTVNGISFYSFTFPVNGIQNGPNGIAIGFGGSLVTGQFLSYEGSFTGAEGLADGLMSSDIGVAETGTTVVGASLGLTGGPGRTYEDFNWTTFAMNSKGGVNSGQTISASSAVPEDAPPAVCLLLAAGFLLGGERFLRRRAA